MKTRFIEGTNEQYSIREDGVVIRHYRHTHTGRITYIESIMKTYLSGKNNTSPFVYLSKGKSSKTKSRTINSLLRAHFGTCICVSCNTLFEVQSNEYRCNDCKLIHHINSSTKRKKRHSEELPKHKVATLLRINTNEVTDEIYEIYTKTLKFKREVAKEHNINIHSI